MKHKLLAMALLAMVSTSLNAEAFRGRPSIGKLYMDAYNNTRAVDLGYAPVYQDDQSDEIQSLRDELRGLREEQRQAAEEQRVQSDQQQRFRESQQRQQQDQLRQELRSLRSR